MTLCLDDFPWCSCASFLISRWLSHKRQKMGSSFGMVLSQLQALRVISGEEGGDTGAQPPRHFPLQHWCTETRWKVGWSKKSGATLQLSSLDNSETQTIIITINNLIITLFWQMEKPAFRRPLSGQKTGCDQRKLQLFQRWAQSQGFQGPGSEDVRSRGSTF
jgi:hypothetical protein